MKTVEQKIAAIDRAVAELRAIKAGGGTRGGQYGTDALKVILDAVAETAVVGAAALSDGFGMNDIPAFVSLYPQAHSILTYASQALAEFKDLDFGESIDILKYLADKIQFIFTELRKSAVAKDEVARPRDEVARPRDEVARPR